MCNTSLCAKWSKQSRFQCCSSSVHVHVSCEQTEKEREREREREGETEREREREQNSRSSLLVFYYARAMFFLCHVGANEKTQTHIYTMYFCRILKGQRWFECPVCVLSGQTRTHTERGVLAEIYVFRAVFVVYMYISTTTTEENFPCVIPGQTRKNIHTQILLQNSRISTLKF